MRNLLVMAWWAFVSLFFFLNWRPLGLISRQAPVIPSDVLAAVITLLRHGLPEAGLVAVLGMAALGAGRLVLRPVRLDIDAGQRTVLSIALGIGLLSYFTFFLGILGGYTGGGLIAAWVTVSLLAVAGLAVAGGCIREFIHGKAGFMGLILAAVAVSVGLFLFAKALKPATFYDAVTYHLGVPKYYLLEGGIKYIPYDSFSNFPFMAEMLYTLGLFLHELALAQYTSILIFLASAAVVYEFCRTFVKEINPALPTLFFLLTPAFVEDSVLYTNDLYLAFFTIMAVYGFFMWERDRKPSYLILTGIFAGICLGTKYSALIYVLVPAGLAVAYVAFRKAGAGSRAFKDVALFLTAALTSYLPWLLKNLINTGNPFYPAFYGVFGGSDMSGAMYKTITAMSNSPSALQGIEGLYKHPWNLFMHSPGEITRTYGAAAFLGPIILMLAPVMLLLRDVPPIVKKLCLLSGVLFLLWDISFPLTRFLYPALMILLIISAYALKRITEKSSGYFRMPVVAGTAFFLFFNLCLGFFQVDKWTSAWGFEHMGETGDAYLMRLTANNEAPLSGYPAYRYINENLDGSAKVLIIGDAQLLYLNRRRVYTNLSAATPYAVFRETPGGYEDISRALKGQGITHVVYNPSEMKRLQVLGAINCGEGDISRIEGYLMSPGVRLVMSSGSRARPVYLYEVI